MDTDDLSEMAYGIIARAAQVSDTLKADLGARSLRYENENDWLCGVWKFLREILEEPGEYVDYWNLEEEEGVTANMMRKIASELFHQADQILTKSVIKGSEQD